ncbi:MAG TPA: hypothetical protein VFV31_13535 [Chitinophagaceae bacterium]|nr:hypothetical protein [Chitinophagaceae bacterium]
MRWVSANGSKEHEIYHLYNGDNKLLTLTLNIFSNSARIECNKEKRVFILRKEGFLRNKTVLRNEYGIKIGELGTENKEYFIDINDQRYFYTVHNNPIAELVVYKDVKENPAVVCGLSTEEGGTSIHFSKGNSIKDATHPGLLMALCWYMFLPVAKENTAEFAV